MKETNFKKGFKSIGEGIAEIGYSCWTWISTHKLITALTISIVLNVWLGYIVGISRAERDNRDSVAYVMEQKVDSMKILTGEGPHD